MLKYPSIAKRAGNRLSLGGRALWCGPFADAVILGQDYDIALRYIERSVRLRPDPDRTSAKTITGVFPSEIARVLGYRRVKVQFNHIDEGERPTLVTFVRERTVKGKTYLIGVADHWVVVKDNVLYHNQHDPCHIDLAPKYRMGRVDMWAEVKPRPGALR
jgi:hypothetical protein